MGHSPFTQQLNNVSWLHGVDVILLLWTLYILDIFCIQLQLTFIVVLLKISCSLWDFGKCLLINQRKNFCNIWKYSLLNGGLNQIIFRDLFFWFLSLIFVTLNQFFFRAPFYSHFAVLNIFSLDEFFDSFSWMEFRI